MKPIKLPVAELKPALTGLGKVHHGRSTLAILNQIKIERTQDGWIALTCTDLDRWITLRLEHPDEGSPIAMLLPFDQLSQIVKSCGKSECIEVTASSDHNLIRFPLGDTLGESKVPKLSPDEFPPTPRLKCDAIPLSSSLRESLLEAMDCASDDSTRLVLNGTLIDAQDSKANYVVATDGRHLYSANSFTLPLKQSVIIPTHKFLEWKEFATDGEWQMRVGTEHLQLSSRRWRFISKTLEGTYPNWRAPIPKPDEALTVINLDTTKLETLIKLIQRMPCHEDRFQTLGLEWKGSQLMLLGKDNAHEPWLRVPVPDIQGQGPDMTVFLDRRYLVKGLGFELNTLSLISPESPIRLHQGGKQLIIMPIRSSDSDPAPSPHPTTAVSTTAKAPAQPTSTTDQPTPKQAMQTQPHPTNQPTEKPEPKSPLEAALLQVEGIKAGYRETLNHLTRIGDSIRAAMREQKASEKEIQGVRQTLRSLQGVRI